MFDMMSPLYMPIFSFLLCNFVKIFSRIIQFFVSFFCVKDFFQYSKMRMSIFLSKRFIKLLDLELEINFCSLIELIIKLELDKLNGKEDSLETTFESTRMVCLRSTGSRYESLSAFCYNTFFPGALSLTVQTLLQKSSIILL